MDSTKIFGVTIDDPWGDRSEMIDAFASHCMKPTARIVFDEGVAASEYDDPIAELEPYCFIMGEILDSYYVKSYSVQQYLDRTVEYLDRFENQVDIWEVGNEVNGDWLGDADSVVQKIEGAFDIVEDRGKVSALTLYYNNACYYDKPQNEMFTWVNENLPESMKEGLDYVLVSYYEDDCEGVILSTEEWQAVFDSLRQIFPNSKLGMGECGTLIEANKAEYMSRYYRMEISTPDYIRGYFWWYYKNDCIPKTKALWDTLNTITCEWLEPAAVNKIMRNRPRQIKIYPNPTTGHLSVNSKAIRKIEVFNILGERVKVISPLQKIDISDQPKGVYFIRMAIHGGWQTVKVIRLTEM